LKHHQAVAHVTTPAQPPPPPEHSHRNSHNRSHERQLAREPQQPQAQPPPLLCRSLDLALGCRDAGAPHHQGIGRPQRMS